MGVEDDNYSLYFANTIPGFLNCTRQGALQGCLFKYDQPDLQCASGRQGTCIFHGLFFIKVWRELIVSPNEDSYHAQLTYKFFIIILATKRSCISNVVFYLQLRISTIIYFKHILNFVQVYCVAIAKKDMLQPLTFGSAEMTVGHGASFCLLQYVSRPSYSLCSFCTSIFHYRMN